MTSTVENKPYDELKVVNLRLVKEPSIISEKPIEAPGDAVKLIANLISQFDREVKETMCIK